MTLLIDNYDSFSYNLYQLVGELDADVHVIRNDAYSVTEILNMKPDRIILSPGPGRPDKAGVCESLALSAGSIPVLGVCLGHQAICEAFGGKITYAKRLMHGKSSEIKINCVSRLYRGLRGPIQVARYHSLAAQPDSLPDCLRVTAVTADGEIMSVEHKELPIYGVQYHPESILTPQGRDILRNFLSEG